MNKRILIDATMVNISIPSGGAFGTQAHMEAMLALYPGLVDVMHPEEAHIRDARYNTIDVPKRSTIQSIMGLLKGEFHRGAKPLVDYIEAHPDTYEMVFLNVGFYAGALIPTLHKHNIKTVLLHHNFESEYQLDSKSMFTFGGLSDYWVRKYEKKGYLNSDINLFVTEQDRRTFEKAYGSRSNNFVSGTFEPTHKTQVLMEPPFEHSAVITCALGDIQNQASIVKFVKQYLPTFHEVLPEWKICLMGRNPSETITHLAAQHDSITLIPNPVDIRSLAEKSAIYLCPMDAGGGIKLRILDGLRAGQPILTHERSARGYEVFANEPFFMTYSDVTSFKNSLKTIIDYIQSPDYSRAHVQKKYYAYFGLQAGTERLKQFLSK